LATVAISACAGSPVTNARICAEIPFLDGPEAACVWTVSQKKEFIGAKEWAQKRPKMLMIDAQSWTNIKTDWLKACRKVGAKCDVQVDSVDSVIQGLDKISEKILKGGK